MFKKGDIFRKTNNLTDDMCLKLENLRLTDKTNKMSKQDYEIAKKGDVGQGERLVNSKKK
jgi:hypothetical protein